MKLFAKLAGRFTGSSPVFADIVSVVKKSTSSQKCNSHECCRNKKAADIQLWVILGPSQGTDANKVGIQE